MERPLRKYTKGFKMAAMLKKNRYSLSLHLQLKVYQNQKQRLKKIPSVDFDNFFTNWSIKDCSFSCAKFQGALFPITHLKSMFFQEVFKNTLNKVALPWTRYMDVPCSSYFLNKLYALFKVLLLSVLREIISKTEKAKKRRGWCWYCNSIN